MIQNTLLGVPIEILSKQDIFKLCRGWLSGDAGNRRFRQIVTVNPEFLMEARKNTEFLHVLQDADLRIADGFGLVCASVFLYGFKRKFLRMTGVELTNILAQLCAEMGKKIYLIGADSGIAEKAAQVLRKKFPSLTIAGAEEGMSKKAEQGGAHLVSIDSGSRIKSGMTD
ncbi:WecB/TagA/CpsF family glycosyltransferase, partial [Candidatus Uhrbacteria bacterium]|nr:WecB/TagA/CpsF family glycosyltransferase [Candidatus Uhrbacteria bacterium]